MLTLPEIAQLGHRAGIQNSSQSGCASPMAIGGIYIQSNDNQGPYIQLAPAEYRLVPRGYVVEADRGYGIFE